MLLFSLDLWNVCFTMPSTATIQNLPSRFPCWGKKQFSAANRVCKVKNNSSQHLKLWSIFDHFHHKKQKDIYQNRLWKKVFPDFFFYISAYYAWNVFFLNKHLHEKRLFFQSWLKMQTIMNIIVLPDESL